MARSPLSKLARAALVALAWLAACATVPSGPEPGSQAEQRALLSAIRAYYENNAVEQNNACKSPLLDAVTRSEVVSREDNQLVVELSYRFSDYVNRRGSRGTCSGMGNRTFTLTRSEGRFRVIDMTGEARTSPSWRIW